MTRYRGERRCSDARTASAPRQKKKQPIPIRITGQDIPSQVKKACSSTYMFKNSGTCINIKVALSGHEQQQIVENVHAVLVQAMEHVPKKWSNVRCVLS